MKNYNLTNKIYLIIFFLITNFFYLNSLYKNKIYSLNLAIFTIILILIIFSNLFFFFIKKELDYFPINFFFNLYILITTLFFFNNIDYIYKNIYSSLFHDLDFKSYNLDLNNFIKFSENSLFVLILTTLFFNLGFFLNIFFFKKKNFNFFDQINEIKLIKLNIFIIFIKIILFITNFFIGSYLNQLLNPTNLLIVSLNFYLLIKFNKFKLYYLLIILFIFFENLISTLALYNNIILLILCSTIFYSVKKKISLILLIILSLWVLLGQSYKNIFRIYAKNFFSQKIIFFDKAVSTNTNNLNNYGLRPIIIRGTEPVLSLIRIQELELLSNKKIRKDTLGILKYSLIPRFLYNSKPKQEYGEWYTENFFNLYKLNPAAKQTTTYNITWPIDFYLNQGLKGSIIISFFVGYLLSLIIFIFSRFSSNNIHFLLGVSVLSNLSIPDFNFSLMFSPILLQYLFLFFIVKIFLIIESK